jgi:hypothetical protein
MSKAKTNNASKNFFNEKIEKLKNVKFYEINLIS